MEDLQTKLLQLDVEMRKQEYERSIQETTYLKNSFERDIFCSEEEIRRRGIEVCLNILKASASVTTKTRELAESKMQDYLNALRAV